MFLGHQFLFAQQVEAGDKSVELKWVTSSLFVSSGLVEQIRLTYF
jgi:hypothetical protein